MSTETSSTFGRDTSTSRPTVLDVPPEPDERGYGHEEILRHCDSRCSRGWSARPGADARFGYEVPLSANPVRRPKRGPIRSSRPIFYDSPVSVRLVRIDPIECSWDEEVTYDVEVRNIGRQAITLPWSAFPPRSQPSGESRNVFPFMVLSLGVGEGMGGSLGWVEMLQGSPDEPGSFRRLPPDATVVIRSSTPCQLTNSKAGPDDRADGDDFPEGLCACARCANR